MREKIKGVVMHDEGADRAALARRVAGFYTDVYERRLVASGLTPAQQTEVTEKMAVLLRGKREMSDSS